MIDALAQLDRFEDTLIDAIRRHHRRSKRRRVAAFGGSLTVLLAGSALAATQLVGGEVSAAHDPSLPQPPAEILQQFRWLGTGSVPSAVIPAGMPVDARNLGQGIYVETRPDNLLCVWIEQGSGQCRDADLGGQDVWLMGDIIRESSETSPFDMHLYGIAKDGVTEIDVTTTHGEVTIPVAHNAFRGTLSATDPAALVAIEVLHTDGTMSSVDPAKLFLPTPGVSPQPHASD